MTATPTSVSYSRQADCLRGGYLSGTLTIDWSACRGTGLVGNAAGESEHAPKGDQAKPDTTLREYC